MAYRELATKKPFIVNKNLGSAIEVEVESTNLFYRTPGMGGFGPHNGNGLLRFPGDVHYYNAFPGKGYSPHTHIVWELNEVKKGQGGTLLVTGSHKSVTQHPLKFKIQIRISGVLMDVHRVHFSFLRKH